MRTYPFRAGPQWDPAVLGDCGAIDNSQPCYVSISRERRGRRPDTGLEAKHSMLSQRCSLCGSAQV